MIDADRDNPSGLLRRRVSQAEADLYAETLDALNWRPAFHLVMRLDGSDEMIERGRATLASLARQVYPWWAVAVIARYRDIEFAALVERLRDGEDSVRALRAQALRWPAEREALRDRLVCGIDGVSDRVVLAPRTNGAGLAALAAGGGRPGFVALLRAGDELGCDALAEFAVASGLDRDADFLYSDEECRNGATGAVEAYCKPQWSPDLLLSANYIGRLWCATPQLLMRAGDAIPDLLRRGEYDLVLRCTEAADTIRHVPAVLCRRWGDRPDGDTAEEQALARALERRGIVGEIRRGRVPGTYRVSRRVTPGRRVSVIIVAGAASARTLFCIETIRKTAEYPDIEIIVAGNLAAQDEAATPSPQDIADRFVAVEPPFHWGQAGNRAAAEASGEFLLFLEGDTEPAEPDWLEALVEHAQRPEVGAVGALLLDADGTVRQAGTFLAEPGSARPLFRGTRRDEPGYFGLAQVQRNVGAVAGAGLMTRRDLFRQVGGFGERDGSVAGGIAYCLKVRRLGLSCIYTPYAALVQHGAAADEQAPAPSGMPAPGAGDPGEFAHADPYGHPAWARDRDAVALDREGFEALCCGHPVFDQETIRRILVLKLDHLGDCVGAVPAIRRLKRHFPQAAFSVLSGPWARPLWALVAEIDEVIDFEFFRADSALPYRRLSRGELDQFHRALAPRRFDLAVDLRRHPETRELLRHTGARYTAGFNFGLGFPWLDIALDWGGDHAGVTNRQHFGDTLVALADAIAAAGERERLVFDLAAGPLSAPQRSGFARVFDRPVVCVHPGAGTEIRRWPPRHYAELIDRLIEEDGVEVVVIGSAGDQAIAAAVRDQVRSRERLTLAVGEIALGDLPGFLLRCALFVGNNSGPKHLAAGLGVPTIGVHSGSVDAAEWGPLGPRAVAVRRNVECAPCHLTEAAECPRDLACLNGLRPADVHRVCTRLLAIGRSRLAPAPLYGDDGRG